MPTEFPPEDLESSAPDPSEHDTPDLFAPSWQARLKFTALGLLLVVSLATSVGTLLCARQWTQEASTAFQKAEERATEAMSVAEHEIEAAQKCADELSAELSKGKLAWKDVSSRLQEVLKSSEELCSAGAWLEPQAGEGGALLFQKQRDQIVPVNDPVSELPKETTAGWRDPDSARVAYVAPFRAGDGQTGAVVVDVSEQVLRKTLAETKPGRIGYTFILSKQGKYISHPIVDYLKSTLSIEDLAKSLDNPEFNRMAETLRKSDQGRLERVDEVSGQDSILVFHRMPSTGWMVAYNQNKFSTPTWVHRAQIWLSLGFFVSLTLVVFLLGKGYTGAARGLWWTSTVWTLSCVVGLGVVWNTALNTNPFNSQRKSVVFTRAVMSDFAKEFRAQAEARHLPNPIFIPTGLYIQSVDFASNDVVEMAGYLWQRYNDAQPGSLRRGVIFADDRGQLTLTEANRTYQRQEGHDTILGWQFHAYVRQSFSYRQYPFDHQTVVVRLKPMDFDSDVILQPDTDAYDNLNPLSLPGLDKSFSLSGWNVKRCYFAYQRRSYNSDFGLRDFASSHLVPELTYNLALDRLWLGPVLSNLFPLLMIAFTIFVNLMTFTRGDKAWGLYGTVAGLFLTSLLAHLKLRDLFSLHDVIYLEYYYLATYAIIVLVAINTYAYGSGSKHRLITFGDNLIPKALFWPSTLTALWALTVLQFY